MVCVNATAKADDRVEEIESVSVVLSSLDSAVEILNDRILVTIIDNSTGDLINSARSRH